MSNNKNENEIILNIPSRFLNIYPFYEDHYNYGVKEFDTGTIYFLGPQQSSVVDCVLQLVTTNYLRTEESEDDMNSIVRDEVNDYCQKLIHEGRIQGQMILSRLPQLTMPKDILQKIGNMTK